jgi:molecular chaperone HscA
VILATEKSLRSPELDEISHQQLKAGELERIRTALAELKQVMAATDREVIHEKTHALNHATQHLAEVMMNRTVREALTGKNVTDV